MCDRRARKELRKPNLIKVKIGEVWKGTRNGFHRHMQSRTNTKRETLLNRVGGPVSKNTDKAEVMQKLNILFTGKVCSHVS